MPMTGVPSTDRSQSNMLHTMRKRITFSSPGTAIAMTVGTLPPGACVVSGGVQVLTAFGAGDVIDVGVTGTAAAYASLLDVASVGFKDLDDLVSVAAGYSDAAELTVTATYTDTGADATAGVGDVIINFVTKPVT